MELRPKILRRFSLFIYAYPFTIYLSLAACVSFVWLLADDEAFKAISIAEVANRDVGTLWLMFCGAGGLLTFFGTMKLKPNFEAWGLIFLASTLATQCLGTWLRFGSRSIFPVLVFASATIACLVRVNQIAVLRKTTK